MLCLFIERDGSLFPTLTGLSDSAVDQAFDNMKQTDNAGITRTEFEALCGPSIGTVTIFTPSGSIAASSVP